MRDLIYVTGFFGQETLHSILDPELPYFTDFVPSEIDAQMKIYEATIILNRLFITLFMTRRLVFGVLLLLHEQ